MVNREQVKAVSAAISFPKECKMLLIKIVGNNLEIISSGKDCY